MPEDGIERIGNRCHICHTKLVWLDAEEKSVCPECNPEEIERSVDTEVDRGDGLRTDGGPERCEMRECEREVHDTVYPGDRKYRLCKPCTAAFLIGHQAGETDPSSTDLEQSRGATDDE